MADFCRQCSIEHFDKDFGDLANLGGGRKLEPGHGWLALCEGCYHGAGCLVDEDGTCQTRKKLEGLGLYPDPDGSKEKAWEKANATAS